MDPGSNGEEPTSWEELYNINLMPSELFLKFRKEIEGIRVGVNLEVKFEFSCPFLLAKIYSTGWKKWIIFVIASFCYVMCGR